MVTEGQSITCDSRVMNPLEKSQFYKNVTLIVNKLQRQKMRFRTFSSGLSYEAFSFSSTIAKILFILFSTPFPI